MLGGLKLRRCKIRFMLRPALLLRTPGWLLDALSSALFAASVAGRRCAPSLMGEREISHHKDFHLASHDSYLGCTKGVSNATDLEPPGAQDTPIGDSWTSKAPAGCNIGGIIGR